MAVVRVRLAAAYEDLDIATYKYFQMEEEEATAFFERLKQEYSRRRDWTISISTGFTLLPPGKEVIPAPEDLPGLIDAWVAEHDTTYLALNR